jgi:hypothetical protein
MIPEFIPAQMSLCAHMVANIDMLWSLPMKSGPAVLEPYVLSSNYKHIWRMQAGLLSEA